MINTFFSRVVIHLRNRHELWFQQDGTTCHAADETMDVLQVMFGNKNSRRVALTWLPRSPDLIAPDYYLWDRVNVNRPENLEDLKDDIKREICAISLATLRSVMNNVLVRAHSFIAVDGQHPKDIVFRG